MSWTALSAVIGTALPTESQALMNSNNSLTLRPTRDFLWSVTRHAGPNARFVSRRIDIAEDPQRPLHESDSQRVKAPPIWAAIALRISRTIREPGRLRPSFRVG
jgi:hypothetical protein